MEDFVMKTPVLLIVFNRPHKAIQVFEKIRQVRPPKLFIVADGPRPNRPGEEELVQQCRALKDLVDWDCDLKVNFAETNMGCRDRIASGITWAFEHVDELIILEDDCVPHVTFFRFCQELLEKYRDDTRIFSITGYNSYRYEPFDESYGFRHGFGCWGWATWKRAWNHFDITMSQWPILKQEKYWKRLFCEQDRDFFEHEFQMSYDKKIDTWAHIFTVNCLANNGLCILPKVNLIRNTGFEQGGTHTAFPAPENFYMDEEMDFPLIHPKIMLSTNAPFVRTPLSSEEIKQRFQKYDPLFRELIEHKRYHNVLTLFKEMLQDTSCSQLTPYHLNYAYYVAIVYFNLGDYEHAEAMLDIVLVVDKKNIDVVLFMAQVQLVRRNFGKFYNFIDTLSKMEAADFTKEQTALLGRMLDTFN